MVKYNNDFVIMAFKKIYWTDHVKLKMHQYSLSKIKILNVVNRPERKEQGIAPGTMGVMQTVKKYSNARAAVTIKTRPPGEIWVLYADVKGQRRIVSAWRYPGVSKPGESIPIPENIRKELSTI